MFKRRMTSSQNPLPGTVSAHLPATDSRQPWEELADGSFVVAGRHALIVAKEQGVVDSGLWHEVQYAKWDALTKELLVVWTDPGREAVRATTISDDPGRFMETVTVRVEKTIVATRSFYTANGIRVAATIRRRVDGELFSVLLTTGQISDSDQKKAEKIEVELRSELGLEE